MKFSTLIAVFSIGLLDFTTSFTQQHAFGVKTAMKTYLSSSDEHDVVRVDLEDGRDYPIYIGTGFDDDAGMYKVFFQTNG